MRTTFHLRMTANFKQKFYYKSSTNKFSVLNPFLPSSPNFTPDLFCETLYLAHSHTRWRGANYDALLQERTKSHRNSSKLPVIQNILSMHANRARGREGGGSVCLWGCAARSDLCFQIEQEVGRQKRPCTSKAKQIWLIWKGRACGLWQRNEAGSHHSRYELLI